MYTNVFTNYQTFTVLTKCGSNSRLHKLYNGFFNAVNRKLMTVSYICLLFISQAIGQSKPQATLLGGALPSISSRK